MPSAEIGATDAFLIGQMKATYLSLSSPDSQLSNGVQTDPLIITTANADYLPSIKLDQLTIISRRDACWGPDDWTQWPQWYFEEFNHLPYVLRRPRKEEMPSHPLRRIWWDMTEADFVEESGCGFTGIGRLRECISNEFYGLREALMVEVDSQDGSRTPDDHRKLHEAATAMRMCTSTLRHQPATFHNVLFTVTAAQRYYLETRAILDKIRKFDPRILTSKTHDVDLSIMGTVTDRPSIVYQFFQKGIPVWFVRKAITIPKNINIIQQVPVTEPHPSLGVVLARWPRAPVFYFGPRCPGMYYATNKWFPGSIDFSNVGPENWNASSQESPTSSSMAAPPSSQASSSSQTSSFGSSSSPQIPSTRREPTQPCMFAISNNTDASPNAHLSLDSRPQAVEAHLSINMERFKQLTSERSSKAPQEWAEALRNVKVDASRILDHSQRALFRGYTFPDAPIFLDKDKGREYLLAWLIIRAPWMGTLTGMEPRSLPLPNPQHWRSYLRDVALEFELVQKNAHKRPTQALALSRTARRNQKTKDAIRDIFSCRKPSPDAVTSIQWNGHIVWAPGHVNLELTDYRLAVWDSQEHNFRSELISLDRCIMSEVWATPQGRFTREQRLRAVFFGEVPLMASAPAEFKSIASPDPGDRCVFVEAFRRVLADWPGDTPNTLSALHFRKCVDGNHDEWDFVIMRAVEKLAYPYYCQAFFDHFGRAATVPHTYPV